MAETKRVSDQYKITAPTIVLDGNVNVLGTSTTVSSTNSTIADNEIVLNSGEAGAGVVTLGTTAGIKIDRGSLPDVSLRWNESTDTWQITSDGTTYTDLLTTSFSLTVPDYSVLYVVSGSFQGETTFTYDPSADVLYVSNLMLGNSEISTDITNGNVTISSNGSGSINMDGVSSFEYQGSTPSSAASRAKFYAATPGAGSSGLYFVNTVDSDELISKKRALMMALIM